MGTALAEPKVGFRETDLVASLCKESFYHFFLEFWEVISPEKLVPNWHIKFLCDELQKMAERVFRGLEKDYDMVVNVSPGTSKSSIFSVAFPPWTWTRMPTARHICGSHTESLVHDLSRKSRDIVISDKYRQCFSDIELRDDQSAKGYWINTKGGSRFSCTIGGKTPMGQHAHFLGVDDPLDPQKAVSDVELAKANYWMASSLPSRKVNKAVTPTVLVMQRLHQADPAGEMLGRKGGPVKHICLPAELTDKIEPAFLSEKYVDGLMDPIRLPRKVLTEAQQEGDYHYAGQYLQDPVPLGGGMFKTDYLHWIGNTVWNQKEFDLIPPDLKTGFKRLVRFWDKAGSLVKGGAFTVGLLMGKDKMDRFWILDVIRDRYDSATREALILKTARSDGRHVWVGVEQEGGSGGKESAEGTVKRLAGFVARIIKPSSGEGNKAMRADPFSTQVNAGNVYLRPAPWNKVFVEEIKYFPNSRYKDQTDAASGAFSVITKAATPCGPLF